MKPVSRGSGRAGTVCTVDSPFDVDRQAAMRLLTWTVAVHGQFTIGVYRRDSGTRANQQMAGFLIRAGSGGSMPKDKDVVVASRRLSRSLLRKQRHERWQHTKAVANRAVEVAITVPKSDQKILIAAAWLHDIGYTRRLKKTGFHPLDGAVYLRAKGWDPRIVALVAHHSGARFVPVERGFAEMMAEFPFEDSLVSDALTYADQTRGPYGEPMTVPYRINEAITRHGPDSPNALARIDRVPYLLAVADRMERRLTEARGA